MRKFPTPMVWVRILTTVLALAFLTACSGGGGEETPGSGGESLTPATVDDATAAEAVSIIFKTDSMMDLVDLFDIRLNLSADISNQRMSTQPTALARGGIMPQATGQHTTEQGQCDSGSTTYHVQWQGPQEPDDCTQVSNVSATFTFNQCTTDASYINGTIKVAVPGTFCNAPAMSVTFSQTTVQLGNIDATMNNLNMNVATSGDTESTTFNGDISTSTNGFAEKMDFKDFTIGTSESNAAGRITTVSGSVAGSCFDGWVGIETLENVLTPDGWVCPSAGRLQVSGDTDVLVTFNSNASITSGDTQYVSCSELDLTCQ